MKERNIFDILGNAEDNSMERLTDKCPEITDAQLDKILAMSERKYEMKKKELERTKKDNNIKMTENSDVEGVERSKRPAWFTPLYTAASLVLVAGIAVGSIVLFKNGRGNIHNGGIDSPLATATTTSGTGTTDVTDGSSTTTKSATTDKNGSTVKKGSVVTTVVTVDQSAKTTNKQQSGSGNSAVSGGQNSGSSADHSDIKAYAGEWQYQVAAGNNVDVASKYNGTVVVKEDGTYTYTDVNGYTSSGTVKVSYEEIEGTRFTTVNFYEGSEYKFGGYYKPEKPHEIHIGNGSMSRLVRGEDAIKYRDYQNTAYDLIEKYYQVMPEFGLRFSDYMDHNDSVTFRITNPNAGFEVQEVEFARISGNGLELNSMDDIRAYKRTVCSENFANKYPIKDCKVINSSINSGDYIDETGVAYDDLMYYQYYIMYKGNLYVNTEYKRNRYANSAQQKLGWLDHILTTEPIVITDITSTSFRAYYSCIMGSYYDSVSMQNCDMVDFVLDPSCGEWRINDLTSIDYSVYQSKAAASKY